MFRAERIPAHLVCTVVRKTPAGRRALSFPCGPCAWCSVSQIEAAAYTVVRGPHGALISLMPSFLEAHSARLNCVAPVSLPSLAQGCRALKTQPQSSVKRFQNWQSDLHGSEEMLADQSAESQHVGVRTGISTEAQSTFEAFGRRQMLGGRSP